jgi:hypothetical protein
MENVMDLFSLVTGIALGAAFSPFWMMVWGKIKDQFTSGKNK